MKMWKDYMKLHLHGTNVIEAKSDAEPVAWHCRGSVNASAVVGMSRQFVAGQPHCWYWPDSCTQLAVV